MNFKKISNRDLIENTKALAAKERALGVEVLHHLREIEVRRIYMEHHSSLFEFAVKALGYSEGAADRRIKAMRLIATLPADAATDVETALAAGDLSLSNVSALQRFFTEERKVRQRSYSTDEKLALLAEIKNKSSREAEKVFTAHAPDSARSKVHFTADAALTEKLERLKELLSHQLASHDMNALMHKLADMALKTLEKGPAKNAAKAVEAALHAGSESSSSMSPGSSLKSSSAAHHATNAPVKDYTPTSESLHLPRLPNPPRSQNPRYVPAKLKAALMTAAQHQCQHTNTHSGQRCEARYFLQIDHIHPVALGGTAAPTNLRVLCAAHNKQAARVVGLGRPH